MKNIHQFIQLCNKHQFIRNSEGQKFNLTSNQEQLLLEFYNNKKTIIKKARQVGLTTISQLYVIYELLYNYSDFNIGLIFNKLNYGHIVFYNFKLLLFDILTELNIGYKILNNNRNFLTIKIGHSEKTISVFSNNCIKSKLRGSKYKILVCDEVDYWVNHDETNNNKYNIFCNIIQDNDSSDEQKKISIFELFFGVNSYKNIFYSYYQSSITKKIDDFLISFNTFSLEINNITNNLNINYHNLNAFKINSDMLTVRDKIKEVDFFCKTFLTNISKYITNIEKLLQLQICSDKIIMFSTISGYVDTAFGYSWNNLENYKKFVITNEKLEEVNQINP
jgi:hypothetical protein